MSYQPDPDKTTRSGDKCRTILPEFIVVQIVTPSISRVDFRFATGFPTTGHRVRYPYTAKSYHGDKRLIGLRLPVVPAHRFRDWCCRRQGNPECAAPTP